MDLFPHYSSISDLSCCWFIVAQMLVYSLGMTLYWSVDFHLPQNQVGTPDTKRPFLIQHRHTPTPLLM